MLNCWIYLFLSTWCVYVTFQYVAGKGDCTQGTYGLNCNYTCHCDVNNCDDVTGCNGGPNSCKRGWSGTKCTIGNVALGKATKQSSYYDDYHNSSLAVDGDLSPRIYASNCILTNTAEPYTWWQVDLGTQYFIQNITVYFRSDYKVRMNGVKIYACQSENWTDACLCYIVKSTDPIIKHITCDKTARYVTLYQSTNNRGDTAMDFCEVQVFACDSHFYGSLCTQDCSERHCNGKSTCNSVGKCDNGCTPDYQSTDCKQECSSDRYGQNCSKLCKCFGDSTCDNVKGTCVDGCQRGYESADCTTSCSGTYGYNCNMSCDDRHCTGRQDCDTENGTCKDGCLAGWEKPDCTVKCSSDRYGEKCSKMCTERKCFGHSTCDAVKGTCVDGCQRGFESTDCTTTCSGTYGYNCNMSCADRHCKGRQDCDTENGTCKDGCLTGWEQADCTVKCRNDTYGSNCEYKCSERHCTDNNSKCDVQNGKCQNGCQPGWKNPSCNEKCNQGTYGEKCLKKCEDRHCLSSENCHHESGLCVGGCLSGSEGETCTQAVTSPGVSKDVIIIVISVVFVLSVVIFISVTVCLIRRFKQKIKNATRESKVNRVRTHQNSEHEDEHYENIEQRTEETLSEPGVHAVSGYVNSQISRDQLGRNTPRNDYVNSSQNIEMNEYEKLRWSENSRNTYEKIARI